MLNSDKIGEGDANILKNKRPGLRNIPYLLVLVLVFLVPFFFLPLALVPLVSSKILLISILTCLSLLVWILTKLKDREIKLPLNLVSLSALLIPVIYVFSTIFSKNPMVSLFGRDIAIDSTISIIIFFILLAITATYFRDKTKVIYAYTFIFLSFIITAVIHLLNILFPAFPSLGILFNSASTTLGKWNDLAIFGTLIVALSIISIESIKLSKKIRIFTYISLALGLILLIIVNFTITWYILGAFAILFFVYKFINVEKEENKTISYLILGTFILSLIFVIFGGSLGNSISGFLNINHFEVRPSFSSTIDIAKDTMGENPLLGSGPALFEIQWLLHKPSDVILTDFWNIDFRYGVGLIPSFITTTGLLGILSWVLFLGLLFYSGIKVLLRGIADPIRRYITLSSFFASMILWASIVFYLPSAPNVALAFVFTGLYIASLYEINFLKSKELKTEGTIKKNFIFLIIFIILLLATIYSGYAVSKKFIAQIYFQEAIREINVNSDLASSGDKVIKAIKLDPIDSYYRSLSEIGTIQLNRILVDDETPQEELIERFGGTLTNVISNYQSAFSYDPLNYNNLVSQAVLYRNLISLNITGSYEESLRLYNDALLLKANSPDILLEIARLEIINENLDGARESLSKALVVKPNYIDAIFLLSQIEVEEGNISKAIETVEEAVRIRPNDPLVYFQLGLLYYNNDEFTKATRAFERAVILNPQFQNAKYFLGLSYYEISESERAVAQFADLSILNPSNEEVDLILNNLQAGGAPFTNAQPPIDDEPENRSEPPIEESLESQESEGAVIIEAGSSGE